MAKSEKITPKEFLEKLKQIFELCALIATLKNSDYANSDDAFANFRFIESLSGGEITAQYGIETRISDKVKRLFKVLHSGTSVKDETIDDTILDLINYLAILKIHRSLKS